MGIQTFEIKSEERLSQRAQNQIAVTLDQLRKLKHILSHPFADRGVDFERNSPRSAPISPTHSHAGSIASEDDNKELAKGRIEFTYDDDKKEEEDAMMSP